MSVACAAFDVELNVELARSVPSYHLDSSTIQL
jgi:hypothetical protein